MSYKSNDDWYFGDYLGCLPGRYYSLFVNAVIILLLAQIALTTESSLQTRVGQTFLDFLLNIIELFFISDYIGKLANSWSQLNYSLSGLIQSLFSKLALLDGFILLVLLTDYFDNDSLIVIGVYMMKAFISIYFSSFRLVLRRVHFILTDSPAYTFFPLVLLSLVTYFLAFCIYLLERFNDVDHFGSIVRAFWFSIVTMTTIGYGDVTPATALGKVLAIAFGIVGIVCIALLTANILEANTRFNEVDALDQDSA